MVAAVLLGIAGGFVLSVPPGPLAVAVSKHGLEGRFRAAMELVLAAAIMDVIYILISAFASSALIVTLSELFAANEWLVLVFQILCILVLLILGIRYLRQKRPPPSDKYIRREARQEERARQLGRTSPFFVGLLIAVTNLATPTFLPSMIAFVTYLQANGFIARHVWDKVVFSFGFGTGTVLWFLVVLRVLLKHRERISANFHAQVYKFAGGTFILFAAVITYNVIITTEWSTLL